MTISSAPCKLVLLLGLMVLAGCTPATVETNNPAPTAAPARSSSTPRSSIAPVRTSACRSGNPLANVYHPDRLQLISACKTVTGVIESIRHEPDGDYHVDVLLDSRYASLLNQGNLSAQHGWLVTEIVPADEPGCTRGQPPKPAHGTYDYGYCTGADIASPPIGTHVSVTGPYVLDQDHGWMEIHPIWRIVIVP
jgi:hypothetical protein